MDTAIVTLVGQLGTASIFVYACYRIYTDAAKERESFRLERQTWQRILERLDKTNNALIMAIENQNTLTRRGRLPYPIKGNWQPGEPEPDIET